MARPRKTDGAQTKSAPHVALLRGVNVGGRNKLAMSDLVATFVAAGCEDVRTYIQSGNVVFSARPRSVAALREVIAAAIRRKFGFESPVIIRSALEMRAIAANNPFLRPATDLRTLHVALLADAPGAKAVAALDPDRSPGDAFEVRGQEIYLHLPNGVARTKLTNIYFDRTLSTVSTIRNWATILKLTEMSNNA